MGWADGSTLPVLVDGEVVVTESIAALQYLAAIHGPTELAPGADDPSYPAYLQFLVFGEASLAAYLNPLVPTKLMAPEGERDNFTARMCEMMFTRRLSLLERQLATKPYAAGDAFTAADISIGYGLDLGARLGLDGSFTPAVKDYWERVRSRPAYQAAVAS